MFPWSRLAFAFAKRFVKGSRWVTNSLSWDVIFDGDRCIAARNTVSVSQEAL